MDVFPCPSDPSPRETQPTFRCSAMRMPARFLVPLVALLVPLLLASCGGGGNSGGPPPPPPPPATVTVMPATAQVGVNGTIQLSATVDNSSETAISWEVDGDAADGIIRSDGRYIAPASVPNPDVVTVTAVLASDPSVSGSAQITVTRVLTAFAGTFSWRNDLGITGENTQEVTLSPSVLTGGGFGKLFSCAVDGYVYAQPLYVANLAISGNGTHNVLFVATEHDSVYAFDADAAPCQTLWQKSFLNIANGVTTVPSCPLSGTLPAICGPAGWNGENDVGTDDIEPEIGITGTPVIDPASQTLYVVAKTKESTSLGPNYVQRLHAIDITTGQEIPGSPVEIQATVPGNGAGNNGMGQVPFDPLKENQRAALALSGGNVYIAFGSHGDVDPFHGWLLAYNAATLAQVAVFNTTPNILPSRGGIGQSGAAPSVDVSGNIFVATGNGTFDANSVTAPNTDYAQTLLRLQVNQGAASFSVVDSFTPFNVLALNSSNPPLDFGASGALLLPDQTSVPPHVALIGSEAGVLYLLNRDSLGGYTLGGPDQVVLEMCINQDGIFGTPVYFQATNTIYIAGAGDQLKAFPYPNNLLPPVIKCPQYSVPISQSPTTFGFPGASPVISANGASNGIVWVIDSSGYGATGAQATSAVLHAYDATNLGNELYNSSMNSADAAGLAVKFAVPTVANGKVYVGAQGEVSVYGLLP
jgi:hypothetical protein